MSHSTLGGSFGLGQWFDHEKAETCVGCRCSKYGRCDGGRKTSALSLVGCSYDFASSLLFPSLVVCVFLCCVLLPVHLVASLFFFGVSGPVFPMLATFSLGLASCAVGTAHGTARREVRERAERDMELKLKDLERR